MGLSFGDKLKKIRMERHLSQEELAAILGTSKQVISRYENNQRTPKVTIANEYAAKLNLPLEYLIDNQDQRFPSNAIPYVRGRRLPILGSIPAGVPILAVENIEGYDYADVPEGENYFFLRVKGDSMINAHIFDGDLVLVKAQDCAESGNIVVCVVNGDEATLKRFTKQGNMVILQPENSAHQPILVSCKDFDNGFAHIVGIAKEVKHKL
ncbi:repressor LexA [Papillibacter cinnamivorans DSM 12816]|uniref:Repressor LexA n=2 Tax=Papillibacter TaxID=100175 RepID=A0A1W1YPH3_9FIRM|nr:repressor LexA [Papillibacter cinnamivorans DSM 12816]